MQTTPITIASLAARRADAETLLSRVNCTHDLDVRGLGEARRKLIADADAKHAQYRQYAGHWDQWHVGRMMRSVETKAGVAFEAGDLCLYKATVFHGRWDVVAYSHRNQCDTAIGNSTSVAPLHYV